MLGRLSFTLCAISIMTGHSSGSKSISEEWERKTIEAIQKSAFTGEVGDGKIFSYEVRNVVKIRTGERDVDALQD